MQVTTQYTICGPQYGPVYVIYQPLYASPCRTLVYYEGFHQIHAQNKIMVISQRSQHYISLLGRKPVKKPAADLFRLAGFIFCRSKSVQR